MKGVFILSTLIFCISCIVTTVVLCLCFSQDKKRVETVDLREERNTKSLELIAKCLQQMCVDK